MEIAKERTLAYKLAKFITPEVLSEVSGGACPDRMSYKTTLVPSGNDPKTLDPVLDASIDC